MFKSPVAYPIQLIAFFLAIITLPNCIHSFRISPERAVNQALDVVHDVQSYFGAAFEILEIQHEGRRASELQSHVIMTMQELGQNRKGYIDWFFDVDHDYELFPFVHYQKMLDGAAERLVKAQKSLVSCKYSENTSRRMRMRIDELEDEINETMYQLKSLRKFVVSHERYWSEKESLEKREQARRELLLKQERNAIEREKLYLEREKVKNKKKASNYNIYDVTVVEYYD